METLFFGFLSLFCLEGILFLGFCCQLFLAGLRGGKFCFKAVNATFGVDNFFFTGKERM